MIAMFFKALFIYLIFLFFRSVWRGYRMVEELKSRAGEYQNGDTFQNFKNTAEKAQDHSKSGDVLEAEYRVLNKDE